MSLTCPIAIVKVSIASMKMTVTKIKLGVSDNVFVLDTKKYPNAVVVRK